MKHDKQYNQNKVLLLLRQQAGHIISEWSVVPANPVLTVINNVKGIKISRAKELERIEQSLGLDIVLEHAGCLI